SFDETAPQPPKGEPTGQRQPAIGKPQTTNHKQLTPTYNIQHKTNNPEQTTDTRQPTTENSEQQTKTYNIQLTTDNQEPRTVNLQHTTYNIEPSTDNRQPTTDLVYFDGNHQKEATLKYFNQLLPLAHNDSVF